jgi:hypothetical protein
MITYEKLGKYGRFGNQLFQIASTIGYAVKNDIPFGFPEWEYQKYFKNPLPVLNGNAKSLTGYLQDYRNFEHCKELIKFYFEMNKREGTHENTVFIHFRAYSSEGMIGCHPEQTMEYYRKALEHFPLGKRLVVFTDDIERAKQVIELDVEFRRGCDMMEDFWIMKNCEGGICANSSFSWWAGYLCGGKVVLPSAWFTGRKKGMDTSGYYFPGSIVI